MGSWGSFKDACGYPIDEYLAPADIKTGGDARAHIRQRGGNGRGKEVGGSGELIPRRVRTGKYHKVPLGCPPAGRHPNTCEGWDSSEGIIADTHEARGQDPGLGLESRVERMTDETQHEAGSWRG